MAALAIPFDNSLHYPTEKLLVSSVLGPRDRDVLSSLALTKDKVYVVVKRGQEFFSELPDLYELRPHNVGLVAFVPEKSKPNIKSTTEKCFDWIVFYDDSQTIYEGVKSLDEIQIPSLHVFGDELAELMPLEKIYLIHCEETSMSEVSRVREKLGLEGTYLEDVKHMRQKELIYELAEATGLPVPKSVHVDFSKTKDFDQILKNVMTKIGIFPMFSKPTMLVSGLGSVTLKNKEDLETWIMERLCDKHKSSYIVQEYVQGPEFSVIVVLLRNGKWKTLSVNHNLLSEETNLHKSLVKGCPLVYVSELLDKFPGMYEFVDKVIDTFNPPHPQIYLVQGMFSGRKKDPYILIEMDYRPPGTPFNHTVSAVSGVNYNTALMLAFMDEDYTAEPGSNWKPGVFASIYYPYKKGILVEHNEPPRNPQITGKIEAQWFEKPGAKMQVTTSVNDMIVWLALESSCEEERNTDIAWICKNWTPNVS